jgi:hypothetical protein
MRIYRVILVLMLIATLWVMLEGQQTWADNTPNIKLYLNTIQKQFGSNEPVPGPPKIVSMEELSSDAPKEPGWGPSENKDKAPGCNWYWYYLPNPDPTNALTVYFLNLRDPNLGQGPVNFFPAGLVIPPNSLVMGWVQVGFCATHLEVEYKLANHFTATNQSFWGNIWIQWAGGWYGFTWQWKHIARVVPPNPTRLFIRVPGDPPPLLPVDFCNCAQYPIDTAITCCGSPDSVFYTLMTGGANSFRGTCCLASGCVEGLTPDECIAQGGRFIAFGVTCSNVQCPTLTEYGLIILVGLIVLSAWMILRKRKGVNVRT